MKTTVDLPDPLFRRAKSGAAERGVSLKTFIAEAVEQRLSGESTVVSWESLLASLPSVSKETLAEVNRRVAESDAADVAIQNADSQ